MLFAKGLEAYLASFSDALEAAGDTTSQVLLFSIALQLLAGNGNGLVQLGLQGFAWR